MRNGFSLTEPMIVLVIVMILSGLGSKLKDAILSSPHRAAMQTIRTLHHCQAQYYSQFRRFAKDGGSRDGVGRAQRMPLRPGRNR